MVNRDGMKTWGEGWIQCGEWNGGGGSGVRGWNAAVAVVDNIYVGMVVKCCDWEIQCSIRVGVWNGEER